MIDKTHLIGGNMKFFLLALLMVVAVGCKEIKGNLNVVSEMELIKKRNKTVTLAPGHYDAEIKPKKRYLRVGITNEEGFSHTFKFPLLDEKQIPKRNGSFILLAKDTGQNVNLVGEIQTDDTWSDERRGYERCDYWARERRCYNDGRRTRCRIERVRRRGYQNVRYQLVTTRQVVAVDFLPLTESTEALAEFDARRTWTDRYYTYTGICR